MSTIKVSNAANATPVLLKSGPCQVDEFFLTNLIGTLRFIKLYDAALAADVTVGTTLPVVVIPVAAAGFTWGDVDAFFALGCVMVCVTGLLDSDATAPSARNVVGTINVGYPGQG
jgi:hypothetical protein